MRIRKRQVPLALSTLSSASLSDPLLNHRSLLVQLQTTTTTNNNSNSKNNTLSPQRPSDHLPPPPPIGDPTNKDCMELLKDVEGGGQDDGRGEKVNEPTRICNSRLALPAVESSNAASLQVRRWGDMGEKAFPFKKRRGSFEKRSSASSSTSNIVEKDKKVLSSSSSKARTVKTKMSKKCVDEESDVIDEEKSIDDDDNNDEETKEGDCNSAAEKQTTNGGGGGAKNKRNRGGTLMEGSRCSRVNGRGWRCCQQTLVGYSLCEHHLGKGRLRSMTSVRSRSVNHHHSKQPVASSNNNLGMSSKSKSRDDDGGEGDNEGENKKNFTMITKNNNKKMKLGVVKARSMSSLLGQEHIRDATNVAYGNDIGNNNDEDSKELEIKREGECETNV